MIKLSKYFLIFSLLTGWMIFSVSQARMIDDPCDNLPGNWTGTYKAYEFITCIYDANVVAEKTGKAVKLQINLSNPNHKHFCWRSINEIAYLICEDGKLEPASNPPHYSGNIFGNEINLQRFNKSGPANIAFLTKT